MSMDHPRRRGPAKGTPRPMRMARADREAQLMDIAEAVLVERGYLATTVEEIADRAGITKPVIYDHFGSKDGLLQRVISRAHEDLEEVTVAAYTEMGPARDARLVVQVCLSSWFQFIDSHRGSFALLREEQSLSLGETQKSRADQTALLAAALKDTDDFAGASRRRLEGVAHALVGMSERYAIWRLDHPEISPQEAVEDLGDLIWNGLRAAKG